MCDLGVNQKPPVNWFLTWNAKANINIAEKECDKFVLCVYIV